MVAVFGFLPGFFRLRSGLSILAGERKLVSANWCGSVCIPEGGELRSWICSLLEWKTGFRLPRLGFI